MPVHIDVYHDLICPWCRIGKCNLDTALAAWTGEAPTVAYHPYVLNPDAPDEPMSIAEFFRTRKGIANPQPMLDRVVQAGANVGLRFSFDQALIVPTQTAHRLVLLTPLEAQPSLLDALHRAHFEEGGNLADIDQLAAIAAGVGLNAEEVRAALQSGQGLIDLHGALRASQQMVQGGVPYFVFDQRFAVSGAQPVEMLIEGLTQASTARIEC
ncbi:MAG: DsbA family protein [Chloroflexota bacterium]